MHLYAHVPSHTYEHAYAHVHTPHMHMQEEMRSVLQMLAITCEMMSIGHGMLVPTCVTSTKKIVCRDDIINYPLNQTNL